MGNDHYQKEVEEVTDKVFAALNAVGVNLLFVHYLSGPVTEPYLFRRSAVRVSGNSKLNSPTKNKMTHDRSLQHYIQYFERDNTYLKMIIDQLIAKQISCSEIKIVNSGRSHSIGETIQENEPNKIITWTISSKAADVLAPQHKVREFFNELYEKSSAREIAKDYKKYFEVMRAQCFGQSFPFVTLATNNKKKCDTAWEKLEGNWMQLTALQSALLYFRASSQGNFLSSTSLIVPLNNGIENFARYGIAIFSPALTQDNMLIADRVRDNIERLEKIDMRINVYDAALEKINNVLTTNDDDTTTGRTSRHTIETFQDRLTHILGKQYEYSNVKVIYNWLLLLTEKLHGKKHEGKPLDFFLVCGDESQFKDCLNVHFRDFSDVKKVEKEFIAPKKSEGQPNGMDETVVRKNAKAAASLISKEHFPWFERGRYALFWDILSTDRNPSGLVSIIGSNWEQIIADRLAGQTTLNIPSCTVCYTSSEFKITGVVALNYPKIEDIMQYRGKMWFLNDEDDRKNKYKKKLEELKLQFSSEQLNNIIDITLRIADDPRKGGTIAFINKNAKPWVGTMGIPWKLEGTETTEDTVSLIAHDGATIRKIGSCEWEYRKLLTIEGVNQNTLDWLSKQSENRGGKGEPCPLSFVGSRRWSAALSAFHKDVRAIVVISQDGDFFLWRYGGKKDKNITTQVDPAKLYVYKFPIDGKPAQYIFSNIYSDREWVDLSI